MQKKKLGLVCRLYSFIKKYVEKAHLSFSHGQHFQNVCKLSWSHDKQILHFDQHIWGFEWEAKLEFIFPKFSLKRLSFSQFCNNFVEIIRKPAEAFNKHITKSVYHDCKKIHWCFESSILPWEKLKCAFCYISLCTDLHNLKTKPIFAFTFIFLGWIQ